MPSPSVETASCVAAADIGGTNLRLAIARRCETGVPRMIASSSTTIAGTTDPNAVVDLISGGVDRLMAENSIPRKALAALAAGAPGITNVDAGIVIVTSYLLGWRDVPLRAMIEKSLGVPASVDNDVNLAALGEACAGAGRGQSDFVFIAIGTGVGAGIVLDGRLFRGSAWTAGEVGYMLLPGLDSDPSARGKPGGLEMSIGGDGIRSQWQSRSPSEGATPRRDLQATEILDLAGRGEPLAKSLLDQTGRLLASAIYNISLVLNCPLFVLGGGVGVHPALRHAADARLRAWGTRVEPRIVPSELGADAQLFGAIRLALDLTK